MAPSLSNQDDRTMAEINITPFTDVLLVLLIIFMLLAALAAPPGFQKSFGKCHAPCGGGVLRRPILVEVAPGPHVFVNGIAVTTAQLYPAMVEAVRRHDRDPNHFSSHIELIGASDAPYDAIIKVLDAGRLAGDDDVGLVVQ
jgi:biopolymer transport protein ExbD